MSIILEGKNIKKNFNNKNVLNNISFSINKGELTSIIGPSGCGKTTLLRILIGLEKADEGSIILEGNDITNTHPSKRKMGIVFQNYSLFENMNVLENVSYPLRNATKITKEESNAKALDLLKMVGLEDSKTKYPAELSGGQRQRVAIVRTLALNPEIILFDEPMSALDANIRLSLQKEIKDLQKRIKTTMIYITHDVEEAFLLSDKIMILNEGVIQQLDSPVNIYNNPANEFVKNFVNGHINNKIQSLKESVLNV
ncbi:MAG: ABC transporter ATP-binding protein [Firmicutes bacterium]|nr:ABC transporter ATP-binding protein [Candidatus Colivicinus equi]